MIYSRLLELIKSIQPSQILSNLSAGNFSALRIDTNFDILQLQQQVQKVLSNYSLIKKDNYQDYLSIGLQYDDDADPLYDAVHAVYFAGAKRDAQYRKFIRCAKLNEIGRQFEFVFKFFSTLPLVRGRLLLSQPGMKMDEHRDDVYTLHIPISTGARCLFFIEGEAFHLPADGSAYLVNTHRRHYIQNDSPIDRIHLVFQIDSLGLKPYPPELKARILKVCQSLSVSEYHAFRMAIKEALLREQKRCQVCSESQEVVPVLVDSNLIHQKLNGFDASNFVILCQNCFIGEDGLYPSFKITHTEQQFWGWFDERRRFIHLEQEKGELNVGNTFFTDAKT